jgi:hypothetical protein
VKDGRCVLIKIYCKHIFKCHIVYILVQLLSDNKKFIKLLFISWHSGVCFRSCLCQSLLPIRTD